MFVLPEEKENAQQQGEETHPNVKEARKLLDSNLVATLVEKENPGEVICQRQDITGIGDLKESLSLRKINMSFNPINNLKSIDQLKELRHLAAYCCRITNIDHLSGTKRVESLMLQQNGIPEIPSAFLSFNKLKELRVDRNQISKLDNLSGCSSLRMLDVSYNKLTSLEGIAGLQSLSELRASHNEITTLKHMRALPNLKELNVSNNKLTNLIGLEQLPTIQAISAENNEITTIQIPQTYMSHLNKQLDKDGGGSLNKPRKSSRDDGESSSTSGTSRKTKSQSVADSKTNSSSTNKSKITRKGSDGNVSDASKEKNSQQVVGLQYLNELYLSGNKIESLAGMESYGTVIESIDFSNNCIKDSQDFVLSKIGFYENLEDIKLSGNIIKENDEFSGGADDMSQCDNSTIVTAKTSIVKGSSTSRLLRQNSSGSKVPLDDNNGKSKMKLDSRRAIVKAKYGNMPLEKALLEACPTLQTYNGVSVEKKKKREAKGEDGVFHTWEDPSLSVVTPSESKVNDEDTLPNDLDHDDEFQDDEDEEEAEHYNANNPVLVVESIVSREEILMHETVFRGLLQRTKDTITKAVKDNLPPEVGEEVTDLVLNVRPVTQEQKQKPTDSTIGKKVRKMMEADVKKENVHGISQSSTPEHKSESKEASKFVPDIKEVPVEKRKPAQLSKNPSALSSSDLTKSELSVEVESNATEEVILKASNRPNTPKTNTKVERKIGSTKVAAFTSDKPPPPVAQFDLRAIKRSDNDIQSARAADDRLVHSSELDDRRRVNSARMESDSRRGGSMRPRMTTNSTSTVRLVHSTLNYSSSNKPTATSSIGDLDTRSTSESIHNLDLSNMDIGMRRAGSAPLSTINSELDEDKSIQWNLLPPSEMPDHVMPPPTTIDDAIENNGGEYVMTEDNQLQYIPERNPHDMVRPSSSHGGVSLTNFRVPVLEEKSQS